MSGRGRGKRLAFCWARRTAVCETAKGGTEALSSEAPLFVPIDHKQDRRFQPRQREEGKNRSKAIPRTVSGTAGRTAGG